MSFATKKAMPLPQILAAARHAWAEPDPSRKCELVDQLLEQASCSSVLDQSAQGKSMPDKLLAQALIGAPLEPGRPLAPALVLASQVPRRAPGSPAGLAALLHAIAHIEFNAINLALDAVWRYPQMPAAFAHDWLSVAADEARHFRLLTSELTALGSSYGAFVAHDGLWEMARRTADDLLARMALVPRVLEARGLDATPVIQRKLKSVGHTEAVAVLQIILDEEVRHVAIGNDWFGRLCQQAGFEPEAQFRHLVDSFDAPKPKGEMNRAARIAAGFSEHELDWLQGKTL